LALQNPPEGLGGISVHGVGNKVVVAAIGSAQMHTYIAGEDTLQGVLWFPCAVQVEVWYGQSDLFSAVSLDGGATWSDTKQYSRPFFGGLSNIGETRWTIIEEGEYYGLKSPGYGTYYGGYQEPSGFALGSVGDTIWAVLPCYSIFLSTERVYVGRPHGLQYNYLGPAQTPCLLFLSSADWSGEFTGANVITTGAVSKGNYAQDNIANQLRARVNANGDKCYILTTYQADDTRLFEVFANGVCKNEEILDVSDTILFLPNFWVRYMPSAGYSFWW